MSHHVKNLFHLYEVVGKLNYVKYISTYQPPAYESMWHLNHVKSSVHLYESIGMQSSKFFIL